jgi:hypothetical protein
MNSLTCRLFGTDRLRATLDEPLPFGVRSMKWETPPSVVLRSAGEINSYLGTR